MKLAQENLEKELRENELEIRIARKGSIREAYLGGIEKGLQSALREIEWAIKRKSNE